MGNVKGFVWYSGPSDETALKLAAALEYLRGKKTPKFSEIEILVNWGARPGSKYSAEALGNRIQSGQIRVLNHPSVAMEMRNKLLMLVRLKEQAIPIPGFLDLTDIKLAKTRLSRIKTQIESGNLAWPLLGLNKLNRGQPSFCYTFEELKHALCNVTKDRPIDYVRSLIDGTEHRVHVFRDTVIAAQRKVISDNPVASVTSGLMKKIKKHVGGEKAAFKDLKLEDAEQIVGILAEDLLLGPTHFQRSVGRGCELKNTFPQELEAEISNLAIRAVDALHLDMGAVHIIQNGKVGLVTNVITYPGLDEGLVGAYAKAIEEFAGGKNKEKQIPQPSKEDAARPELVAALHRKIDSLTAADLERILKAI